MKPVTAARARVHAPPTTPMPSHSLGTPQRNGSRSLARQVKVEEQVALFGQPDLLVVAVTVGVGL